MGPADKQNVEDTSNAAEAVGRGPLRRRKAPPDRSDERERPAPVNAIQASRRRRHKEGRGATPEPRGRDLSNDAGRPKAGDAEAAGTSTESDPWTVPASVRDRFVQDGNRFYFPDGSPAFRDLGRRLATPSENTQLIHSLIEIAQSRSWSEITVTGTERFRLEVWRQARIAGLAVRGYRPTQAEQAQMIRSLGRQAQSSAEGPAERSSTPDETDASRARRAPEKEIDPVGAQPRSERVAGKLLKHGPDAYRHDPQQEPSYFVRVQTISGPREIWGKDLERAIAGSLSRPQIGDEVVLQRTGQERVTVRRQERDEEGRLDEKPVKTHRNRWMVEKRGFFEDRTRAADMVRDSAIDPRTAVREHPELAGTYLNLKAAELAARTLRDAEDRRRFLAQVRRALAEDIERGEPLPPVRLRERVVTRTVRSPARAVPAQGRVPE
jgi:Large polyvalent protein-associated domain 7